MICLDYNLDLTNIDFFHRVAFKILVEYFRSNYKIELDESGRDTTRLCFLSSDANLVVKDHCKLFSVNQQDVELHSAAVKASSISKVEAIRKVYKKGALLNAVGKNLPQNRLAIKSIIKFLKQKLIT